MIENFRGKPIKKMTRQELIEALISAEQNIQTILERHDEERRTLRSIREINPFCDFLAFLFGK